MVKNLIIIFLILIIVVGSIVLFPYIQLDKAKEGKVEIDLPIETFFPPVAISPTPAPTITPQIYFYQAPAPVHTPQPTVDPYWVPGPWGEYVYG